MLTYPNIDPVAFYVFSWPVHWYGMMYLIGFFAGWGALSLRVRNKAFGFTQEQLSDIVFYTALGAIVGGRSGYILFYDWQVLFTDPIMLFKTWNGGMSFHGGLLGVIVALILCAKKHQRHPLALLDLVAPGVPLGLAAGRIGNFINGELWGRVTDVPWAMVFPNAGTDPRHPSQLYEFGLEGIVMFIILWVYASKPRPVGMVSGLFAILYSVFRFSVEFFREPDLHIGYVAFGWLTEGQLLSVPLFFVGVGLMLWGHARDKRVRTTA